MNTIYMKIYQYEEESKSIIVGFASDTTNYQDPDQYRKYAFQPLHMYPDISDPNEILKRIALAGIHHIENIEREENFVADPSNDQAYKNMVGQQYTFTKDEVQSVHLSELDIINQNVEEL